MESCVYIFTSPSNKFYIGQTINFNARLRKHLSEARKGSTFPFHSAIQKHGIDKFSLVKIPCNQHELDIFEKLFIVFFQSIGSVYNCNSGGRQCKIISQETRDKISKAGKNKKLSQEHKDKIRESLMGNKNSLGYNFPKSEETKAKLRAIKLADPNLLEKMKRMSLLSIAAAAKRKLVTG